MAGEVVRVQRTHEQETGNYGYWEHDVSLSPKCDYWRSAIQLSSPVERWFLFLNILYTNSRHEGHVLKLSDFRFVYAWLFRPLAAWISRREYTIYQMVADIPGVPALGSRYGLWGYFHRFIEGKTLHEIERQIIERGQVTAGHLAFATQKSVLRLTFSSNWKRFYTKSIGGDFFVSICINEGISFVPWRGSPILVIFKFVCICLFDKDGWGLSGKRSFNGSFRKTFIIYISTTKPFNPNWWQKQNSRWPNSPSSVNDTAGISGDAMWRWNGWSIRMAAMKPSGTSGKRKKINLPECLKGWVECGCEAPTFLNRSLRLPFRDPCSECPAFFHIIRHSCCSLAEIYRNSLSLYFHFFCSISSSGTAATHPIQGESLIALLQILMFAEILLHSGIIRKDFCTALPIFLDRQIMRRQ